MLFSTLTQFSCQFVSFILQLFWLVYKTMPKVADSFSLEMVPEQQIH